MAFRNPDPVFAVAGVVLVAVVVVAGVAGFVLPVNQPKMDSAADTMPDRRPISGYQIAAGGSGTTTRVVMPRASSTAPSGEW